MATYLSDSPIFVVGAPRSGTSVLTWCLGQHPNILPTEESNWMGEFAVTAAAAHALGSLRGERSQLSACGLSREAFLGALGQAINQLLLSQRERLLANADRAGAADPGLVNSAIQIIRNPDDPKFRWVDGTPEYSLQISALRALFPSARFIHIVRDVRAVVKSLMLFRADSSQHLVRNEQEAIGYWLRCVRECLAAEEAWGSGTVLHVRYSDLLAKPADSMKRMLEFFAEPFSDACLEPLSVRLNSSRVPSDFDPHDPATDSNLRDEADRFFAELESRPDDALAADALKAAEQSRSFEDRVAYSRTLDAEYLRTQEINAQLNQELVERGNWTIQLDREIATKNARIVELQNEVEDRNAWAIGLDQQLADKGSQIIELQRLLDEARTPGGM